MKILLFNPPNIEEPLVDGQMIPIGVVSINLFLKFKGFDSKIINLYYYNTWSDIEVLLREIEYDLIGIPCYTRQRFSVIKLAELCKSINTNSFIVIGGPHTSFLDSNYLGKYPFIDCIVRNEGEYSFYEIAKRVRSENISELCSVKGISYRLNNTIHINEDSKTSIQLDKLPIPIYDKAELENVNDSSSITFHFDSLTNNEKIAPLIFSRGCNHNCYFCCNGAFWLKQNYYCYHQIIDQLEYYYTKHKIRFFDIYDDNFLVNIDLVKKVLNYIIDNKYNIHWWCSTRLDSINDELIPLMASAGCFMISFGIESGSDKTLTSINKNISLDLLPSIRDLLKANNIQMRFTISIGHPDEDLSALDNTIDIINNNKPTQVAIFLTKVYPGTPLYKKWLKNIGNDDYWFNKNHDIVPFFQRDKLESVLLPAQEEIIKGINAKIVKRTDSKVFSTELYLKW